MEYHCDVCNISVNSEQILEDHYRGKKHRKNQEQHGGAVGGKISRTLRVKNFPRIPFIDNELWAYFERYGPVEDVYVEYRSFSYALVTFKKPGSAHTAQQQKKHWLGDFLLEVTLKEGKGQGKDDVAKLKETKPEQEGPSSATDIDEMNQRLLDENETLDDQINRLVEEIQLSPEDTELRKSVVDMLQGVFSLYFPGCTIHQFGSSVNGFGSIESDMDIFLDLNLDKPIVKEQATKQPQPYPYVKHIESFRNMKGSFMSRDELEKVPVIDKAKLVAKILTTAGKGISNVLTIPSNRCPLVRFVHNPTGKKIDLSLNNRIALVNTSLIQFYVDYEPRFQPLMHTIRYWAKVKEITGNISAGPRLTNYALSLLVIFYLENVKPKVLPTPEELAMMCADSERNRIDMWDCTLMTDKNKVPPSSNTMTVLELLTGFFKFYSEFDFVNTVISTRTGLAIPMGRINQHLSGSALTNFRIGPFCIQDPFVLEHNTALNVNERISKTIYGEFHIAYQKLKNPSFGLRSETQSWGLPYLFSKENIEVSMPKAPVKAAECSISIPMTFGTCPKLFTIAASQGLDLNESWCMYVCKAVKFTLEKVLSADVRTYMDKTLESLKIDIQTDDEKQIEASACDETPEDGEDDTQGDERVDLGSKRGAANSSASDAKKIKTAEEQDASDAPSGGKKGLASAPPDKLQEWEETEDLLMVCHASVKHKVWTDRKNFSKNVPKRGVSPVVLEAKITKEIKDSGEHKMWSPVLFTLEMFKEMNPCQVNLYMRLESPEMRGDFNMLFAFLKQFIPKVLANV